VRRARLILASPHLHIGPEVGHCHRSLKPGRVRYTAVMGHARASRLSGVAYRPPVVAAFRR
jgi:hypothetical protein